MVDPAVEELIDTVWVLLYVPDGSDSQGVAAVVLLVFTLMLIRTWSFTF